MYLKKYTWLLISFCWDIKPHTICTFKASFCWMHTSTCVCFSAARLYQRHHTRPAELWTPPGTQGLTEVQSGRLPLPGLLTVCRGLSWMMLPTSWRCSTLKKKKKKERKKKLCNFQVWLDGRCAASRLIISQTCLLIHKTCLKNFKLKKECIIVNMPSEFSLINESYRSLLFELLNTKHVNYSVRLLMLTCAGDKLNHSPHVLH